MNIGLITLGCDKNTVDSERYLAQLASRGGVLVTDLRDAEIIVVNTCGFIDAAKQESIEALIDAGRYKTEGICRTLVAVGCMVERHQAELVAELPEVDLFLGASEMDRLLPSLEEHGVLDDPVAEHPGARLFVGGVAHVRYLKVSEGCDHGCAFCAIPLMRGKHRSFAMSEVIHEAQLLELQGALEVNLVAQDLAHYGRDRRDGVALPELLEGLVAETSIPWLRLLYLYSAGITPRMLEVIARAPRILPYLDMPIQHGSDVMLARMRRPERQASLRARVAGARAILPDVALRTTCIVGFPGETEADVEQLLAFLEEIQFDRVGVFTYSAQEGTHAAGMADDVPATLKRERQERVEQLQRRIAGDRAESRVGQTIRAIVDRAGDVPGRVEGRVWRQADGVDGVTMIAGAVSPGSLVDARITRVVDDYDLEADVVGIVSAPAPAVRAGRMLPMAPALTVGSYGR